MTESCFEVDSNRRLSPYRVIALPKHLDSLLSTDLHISSIGFFQQLLSEIIKGIGAMN